MTLHKGLVHKKSNSQQQYKQQKGIIVNKINLPATDTAVNHLLLAVMMINCMRCQCHLFNIGHCNNWPVACRTVSQVVGCQCALFNVKKDCFYRHCNSSPVTITVSKLSQNVCHQCTLFNIKRDCSCRHCNSSPVTITVSKLSQNVYHQCTLFNIQRDCLCRHCISSPAAIRAATSCVLPMHTA